MCNFGSSSVPKGWQWVCLKSSGAVSPYSQDCSVFCSPNGKRFTSLEKVHEFNRQLEKAKLEKEHKRLLAAENLKQFQSMSRYEEHVKVNSSQYEPLNLSKKEVPRSSYQVDQMQEVVNRNRDAANRLKLLQESNVSSLFPTGISVSGPSLKRSNINQSNNSEGDSSKSNVKDLPFKKRQKYQQLIMEQNALSGSNLQNQSVQNISNTSSFFARQQIEPRKPISSEFRQLQPTFFARQQIEPRKPISSEFRQLHPTPTNEMFSQSLPKPEPLRRPAPISGEEILQAMNRMPSSKKPRTRNPIKRKELNNPNKPGKNQVSVAQACKFLGLKDYPVPINENNKQFFSIRSNFDDYYLPLVASVNRGANPLSIKTLVKAKWFEVLQAKMGESKTIYFNKPRRNKVKVNVLL